MPARPASLAQQQPPIRHSLCRALGHDWSLTTADTYRRCQRWQCGALQRYEQGQWVTLERQKATHGAAASQAEQAALW